MCHQISEEVVRNGTDPASYLGRTMIFWEHPESDSAGEDWKDLCSEKMFLECSILAEITVTEEHIEAVASATDYVFEQHRLHGGDLLAEERVPIGHFTGEEGATGTTDILIL